MAILRIPYRRWKFEEPKALTESQFRQCKDLLNKLPEATLIPDSNKTFWAEFKIEIISIVIGILGFFISYPIEASNLGRDNLLLEIIDGIGIICFMIGFFAFLGFLFSLGSYLPYESKRLRYFDRIKIQVINSKSYEEYLLTYVLPSLKPTYEQIDHSKYLPK